MSLWKHLKNKKVAYHKEIKFSAALFGLSVTTETLLKDCLKIGINAVFQLSGGISGGLEPDKTTLHDKCTELKPKTEGMYLWPLHINHNLFHNCYFSYINKQKKHKCN